MTSKQKGILTELLCITELSSIGCTISTPYGDNARYDMIADYKHNLIRIQCKTARKVQDGVYRVHNRSAHCNMTRVLNIRYTKEDADFIGTYFDKKCYLIPIDGLGVEITLRTKKTKNHQSIGVKYADRYEARKILKELYG